MATNPPSSSSPALNDGPTSLVARGDAVIRIENETLAQVAIQRPRDERKVLEGALRELEMVPEDAARAYYEIPYRDTAPGGEQKMVKVSGPSIKAATALARRWGNCSATARVLSEDHDAIDLEGVFIDFETSVRFTRPLRVSKWVRVRRSVVQLDSRRLEAAIGAGASKAMRNAILTGLPSYLVAAYDRKARELTAGGKVEAPLDAKTVAAIVKAFREFNVEQPALERYLEKPAAQWLGADRASLVGVFNALKDNATSVDEVFGRAGEPEAAAGDAEEPSSRTLTPDSFVGAEVTGENFHDPRPPADAQAPMAPTAAAPHTHSPEPPADRTPPTPAPTPPATIPPATVAPSTAPATATSSPMSPPTPPTEAQAKKPALIAETRRLYQKLRLSSTERDTFTTTYTGGIDLNLGTVEQLLALVGALRARAGEPRYEAGA